MFDGERERSRVSPQCPWFWVMNMDITEDICTLLIAILSITCPLSLSLLLPLLRSLRALRFHTHPQLLVPEQQFASGFIELQPVDPGVVADGSQIVAPGQVH